MNLNQSALNEISNFSNQLSQKINFKEIEDNAVIEIFLYHQHCFKQCDILLTHEFSHKSIERDLQIEFGNRLFYGFKRLCQCDTDMADNLIWKVLQDIPALRLLDYNIEELRCWRSGRLINQYFSDLEQLIRNKLNNRSRLRNYLLYITYPTIEEIAALFPRQAERIFPIMFDTDWDVGWRMHAAKVLHEIGFDHSEVQIYHALSCNDFNSDYFQSEQCLEVMKEAIHYYVVSHAYDDCTDEIIPIEEHLRLLSLKLNSQPITRYLNSKWQFSPWKKRTLKLENGWKFPFRRAPYVAAAKFQIPGGEAARDDIRASYPEQLEWLHQTLKKLGKGDYFSTWTIDFTILSEALLQQLIAAILSHPSGVCEDSQIPAANLLK